MMWKQVVAVCAIALGLVSGSMCVQAQSSVQEAGDAFLQPVYTIDIEATAAALQPVGTVLSVSWWYDDEAHGLLASTVQVFLGVDKSGFNVVQEFDVARGFGRVLGQAMGNGVQESMREGDVLSPRTLQVLQAVKKTDPYVLCLSLPFGTQPPAGAGGGRNARGGTQDYL